MNKNISIWRGYKAPPTNYHVWIKLDNKIYIHDGNGWNPIIDSAAKIDIINELPSTSDLKNGEFLLYQLGKDITISDTTLISQFGKTSSFTASEGDLYLVGKVKHVPDSTQPEEPKFSEKYKYKILFNANPNYYFGGSLGSNNMVLTSLTLPLTYSLIGNENDFILKCDRYYLYINGSDLCYTTSKSSAQHFKLHEYSSGKYELLSYNNTSEALNAYRGLGTTGDNSDAIRFYNKGDSGNVVIFLPQESETIIRKIITSLEATSSRAGLMSAADKSKLNGISSGANNYSLPLASSITRGGIKIGYSSQSANNRPVQLSSEKAYVNIPDVTTSQAGLMSSSDKTRLNGLNVYRHVFTDLSGLPSSGDGWYSIIDLGDTEAAIVQISGGQSDTQVAVSAGWGGNDKGSLVVLNTTIDVNNYYSHVKAVRIRRHKAHNDDVNGYLMLEAKLNRTGYGSSYKNTIVSVFTSAGHNPIVINADNPNAIQLNSSTSETVLQEFELLDKTIMAKAINVEEVVIAGKKIIFHADGSVKWENI